jgi:hypothetical protein
VFCGFAVRSGATKLRHRPAPGFVQVRLNVGTGLYWYFQVRRHVDTDLYLVLLRFTSRRHRPVLVFSGSTSRRHRPVPGIVKVRRLVDTGLYLVYSGTTSRRQVCTWFIQVRRLVDT